MYKSTNQQKRHKYQRWLLAFVLAGLLATTNFYIPMMTTAVYACQSPGSGGC